MTTISFSAAQQMLKQLRTLQASERNPVVADAMQDVIDRLDTELQSRLLTKYWALATDTQQPAAERLRALDWVRRALGTALL